jgi:hypothetical protein
MERSVVLPVFQRLVNSEIIPRARKFSQSQGVWAGGRSVNSLRP